MKLSFIIPCYRSENTIMKVIEEIETKVSEKPEYMFEIIAVNDNSPDDVLHVLRQAAGCRAHLKIVDFSKNFGQHAAMMAGLSYATGDQLIFLDDDFQCPVDRLWDLLEPLNQGYDVSFAKYKFEERKESFFEYLAVV